MTLAVVLAGAAGGLWTLDWFFERRRRRHRQAVARQALETCQAVKQDLERAIATSDRIDGLIADCRSRVSSPSGLVGPAELLPEMSACRYPELDWRVDLAAADPEHPNDEAT